VSDAWRISYDSYGRDSAGTVYCQPPHYMPGILPEFIDLLMSGGECSTEVHSSLFFAANLTYRIEWLDNATVAPTFNSSLADSHVHLYANFVTSADMSHKWLTKVG
jgi:hypothetical protein